jgi:hypothetical protein
MKLRVQDHSRTLDGLKVRQAAPQRNEGNTV